MKRFLFILSFFVFSQSLLAQDDFFSLKARLHGFNTFDQYPSEENEGSYLRYFNPQLTAELNTILKLEDYAQFDLSLTNADEDTCEGTRFLKKASMTLKIGPLFSTNFGCLNLERGGWSMREEDAFSQFDQSLKHTAQRKYTKALNLNLNFLGQLRVQLAEDKPVTGKEGQIALNTAWLMDLYGAQPIFQIGFYNGFRSFHYTLGIKGELNDFHFYSDFSRDHFRETQKGDLFVTQEETAFVEYQLLEQFSTYLRYYKKTSFKNSKEQVNEGNYLKESNWKYNGLNVSLGGRFHFSQQILSYLAVGYKRGLFSETEKDKWSVRVGIQGTI